MSEEEVKPLHSTEVANHFWDLAASRNEYLTPMQYQKLVYFAHGWHLAINDSELTYDRPEVWPYGPVYAHLWISMRRFRANPLDEKIRKIDLYPGEVSAPGLDEEASRRFCHAPMSAEQRAVVQKVFDVYGHIHAFELSALTHQKGTPWHEVYVEQGNKRGLLPSHLIKEHFIELARKRNNV